MLYIELIVILPVAMIALAPDLLGDADAAKAEGSPVPNPQNPMVHLLTKSFAEIISVVKMKIVLNRET